MLFNKTMDYLVVGVYRLASGKKTEQCVMHNTTKREAKEQMFNYLINNKLGNQDGSFRDILSISVHKE
ncbi:hypothetical protein [Loigolactobacillus backii]|uniref:Uncharacterized protein n=1 Tax=Loigolactobacillus backii TaxID=375175 RepID=A0A192H0X1_9LACO|nr:hypothetical protein [Loigolactobacillus backii]ANK60830.1 hypothetical protein AYR52_11555 [Loigolactobacillus backii]ANK61596.1 hypothetical protein AYR53_01750 [Loigolactobacillus backii]ANK65783.1 hypothetical protein AYR54_11350 [Loigolactobacillus backii]ANK68260.1 hypothetical protein AYR55_11500 [Loigolactobacillus backii]ANK69206.1 hypothetical protein AYR56_02965 [Loigolactobacillus backii]